MKKLLLILMIFLILPMAFAQVTHEFVVNKYFFQQSYVVKIDDLSTLAVEPLITAADINACEQVELSFKLNNPSHKSRIYSLRVKDFKGVVYLTPSVALNSKESRIINFILEPDCSLEGEINPKIVIENDKEKVEVPVLLRITPLNVIIITESECAYHYNTTVCSSESYIKFFQGTSYEIDLNDYFYDPDGDVLTYSAQPLNLKVKIKGSRAILTPRWDFHGKEEVVFFADDNKGGKVSSRKFFMHVLPNDRPLLENFVTGNLVLVILLLLILITVTTLILVSIRKERKERKEKEE